MPSLLTAVARDYISKTLHNFKQLMETGGRHGRLSAEGILKMRRLQEVSHESGMLGDKHKVEIYDARSGHREPRDAVIKVTNITICGSDPHLMTRWSLHGEGGHPGAIACRRGRVVGLR